MLYSINRQKTRTSRPICTTLNVAKLFYLYAIYELQYNLAVVILWQVKQELRMNYHTIRPKFVCAYSSSSCLLYTSDAADE